MRDLAAREIDRRFALARWDIRHGGTGDIAREDAPIVREPLRTKVVLAGIATADTTIQALARHLNRELTQVWGHVCFLRKMQKVEVKRWVISSKGRKMAVYGLK